MWWQHVGEPLARTRAAAEWQARAISLLPSVAKYRVFAWLYPRFCRTTNLLRLRATMTPRSASCIHAFTRHGHCGLAPGLALATIPRYTPTTTLRNLPLSRRPDAEHSGRRLRRRSARHRHRQGGEAARRACATPGSTRRTSSTSCPRSCPAIPTAFCRRTRRRRRILKKRTLTNLYNARPQWLADAHRDLDAAVAAAYGWPADISEEDALAKLLELNFRRVGREKLNLLNVVNEDADEEDDRR